MSHGREKILLSCYQRNVPGVRLSILSKFKILDFDKYEGKSCPKIHLIVFYRKMVAHVKKDKLMRYCF